ncbi:MAG: PD-(D/E)XK nuclease family protein [Bacteriovorax sp.]|nr:PD-(D/E)XK nuclease family protein [Bacteriovorax sp.]
MLEVIFFESNQDLLEQLKAGNTPLIICPSPKVADNLRSLVPELEVITISKWISDHLKKLGLKRSRKSELMIKLSAVWKHYFPNEKTALFLEAFELFTELRSYTLNLELLAEFFKELDEVIVKSVLVFWTYLDQEKIIDEHLSYKKVAESKLHRAMWFIGFKHMSGVQIDMLKVLSEEYEVEVFFPRPVFQESLPNDWIGWMTEEEPKKSVDNDLKGNIRVAVLPKGKANIILKKFFETHSNYDLVLASTQASLVSFQEAQKEKSFFKTSEDLFTVEIEILFIELKKILKEKKQINIDEMLGMLLAKKIEASKKGEYRKYKIIELTEIAVKDYSEFQTSIDSFAFDIFQVIIRLNAPRVSLLSLEKNIERSFLDVSDLDFRDDEKPTVLLATGSMGGFRANEKILSEAMTKALRSIGPIKRAGLDFHFHKYELLSILAKKEAALLIEEQVLETDLSWREILKNFEAVDFDLGIKYSIKKIQDYLTPKRKTGPFVQKNYSASKLQAFIDCPQKFYFSYIDKIDNRPEERASLSPDELGNLEHEIIASYFDKNPNKSDEIDLSFHRKICLEVFNSHLTTGKLILSETEKARAYNEIMHYSWNGIVYLIDLMKVKNSRSIKFEVQLNSNPWNLVGSVDCILELNDNKIIVIDFKRSSAAAGTKTETMEFRKIQMWVYLLALRNQGFEIESFGYLNLSDLADTNLIFETDDTQKLLSSSMATAQEIIVKAINDIQQIIDYIPAPRESKVCHYCSVNLFCLKGGSCE